MGVFITILLQAWPMPVLTELPDGTVAMAMVAAGMMEGSLDVTILSAFFCTDWVSTVDIALTSSTGTTDKLLGAMAGRIELEILNASS